MKVLLIATRDPYGRPTGRKIVLRTIIRAAHALGHEVRVLAVTKELDGLGDVEVLHIRPPKMGWAFLNVLTYATRGKLSLNECLYQSPSVQQAVNDLCCSWRPDVIVADMLRTAKLALDTGLPVIVDLDDLLSTRYRLIADSQADASSLLGYYASVIPRWLRWPVAKVAGRLLRIEARLVTRREHEVARQAAVISLVAADEAEAFGRATGRPVAWLPMAIDIPAEAAPVASNPNDALIFVGGLDYHANLEAVRDYVRSVAPELAALGFGTLRLRIVGYCPPEVEREFENEPSVQLAGYVEDLLPELARARVFVATIPPGTGIKVKVLEAMAQGIPVAGTPDAFKGLAAIEEVHCLVGSDARSLAQAIVRLVREPATAARIGGAGRALAADRFGPEVVARKWSDVLKTLV